MKKDSQTLKHQGELYELLVEVRQLAAAWDARKHLGQPARGVVTMLREIAEVACDAHRDGGIIDVHVDVYAPLALPGWFTDLDGNAAPHLDDEGNGTAGLGDTPF